MRSAPSTKPSCAGASSISGDGPHPRSVDRLRRRRGPRRIERRRQFRHRDRHRRHHQGRRQDAEGELVSELPHPRHHVGRAGPGGRRRGRGLRKQLSKALDVDIGTTTTELDTRTSTVRSRESAFGDVLADAVRASTQAEIAIVNGGSIRADTIYPPGTTLTRRDILTELPFGNTTCSWKSPAPTCARPWRTASR